MVVFDSGVDKYEQVYLVWMRIRSELIEVSMKVFFNEYFFNLGNR